MIVTRAAFLRVSALALAGLRLQPRAFASSGSDDEAASETAAARFRPYVGDRFAVCSGDGSTRARLTLHKIIERPLSNGVEQYSVMFHGAPGEPLADGIYTFRHAALGAFTLFISSAGAPGDDRRGYQACFSRHVRT